MSYEMEQEDFMRLKDAEIAALKEQIDNLVAMICAKDREILSITERLNRMTVALDDALGTARGIRARDEAYKAELEALNL
jgi:predicted RNase H-like nuclease (RuvC/YqgF family)